MPASATAPHRRLAIGLLATLPFLAAPALADPVETVLHNFSGKADGAYPYTALAIDSAGVLYATTSSGTAAGFGTVDKLVPPASGTTKWTLTRLHAFAGGNDGALPFGAVILGPQGQLYGTTYQGGAANAGIVFELDPPTGTATAWHERILYTFKGGADGANPAARLTLAKSGRLYGTTTAGGVAGASGVAAGNGVVFTLIPPATAGKPWTHRVIYSFTGSGSTNGDGASPYSGVIIDSQGALYGVTSIGGVPGLSANCTYRGGCGTAYKLSPPTASVAHWTETVLWRFGGVTGDGAGPFGEPVVGPGGVLYGVTTDGGSYPPYYGNLNLGTAFALTPPASGSTAWTETVIHNFGFFGDFAYPLGSLLIDSSGALYGAALDAGSLTPVGASGGGGVFKLTPPAAGATTWTETHLHDFTDSFGDYCLTGCYPEAGVVADSAGTLYGTTFEGGTFKSGPDNISPGVVFKITQ